MIDREVLVVAAWDDIWAAGVSFGDYDAQRSLAEEIVDRILLAVESNRAYEAGEWCGECAFGVVEDPPCCTQPSTEPQDVANG